MHVALKLGRKCQSPWTLGFLDLQRLRAHEKCDLRLFCSSRVFSVLKCQSCREIGVWALVHDTYTDYVHVKSHGMYDIVNRALAFYITPQQATARGD